MILIKQSIVKMETYNVSPLPLHVWTNQKFTNLKKVWQSSLPNKSLA